MGGNSGAAREVCVPFFNFCYAKLAVNGPRPTSPEMVVYVGSSFKIALNWTGILRSYPDSRYGQGLTE